MSDNDLVVGKVEQLTETSSVSTTDAGLNGTGNSSMSVDEMRAKIFSSENKKKKTKIVDFFGVSMEMHQPTIGDVVDSNSDDDDEITKVGIISDIIEYAYRPGMNEKVFTVADIDMMKELPMGEDFTNVIKAMRDLSGVKVEDSEKN